MPMKVHNEKVKDEVYECTIFYNQTAVDYNCLRLTFIINSNNNKDDPNH
jgi:hypothetical protein